MRKSIITTILAVLCSFVFVFGLTACDNGNENKDNNGGTTTTEHTLTEHKAKEPTCTEEGNLAYWECADCGKLFSDKDGTTETTLAAVMIAAKGHTLTKTDGKPATCKDEGITEYWTCTVCKKLFSDGEGKTEITQADTVIPVTDNHTYGEWKSNNSGHWKVCEVCGKQSEKADHDFGDGLTCTACGYEYNPAEDTAPATLDELFPDEVTATAVELKRAAYYKQVIYTNLENNVRDRIGMALVGANKYQLGKTSDTKWEIETDEDGKTISKIRLFFTYHTYEDEDTYYIGYVIPDTEITITDLIKNNIDYDITFKTGRGGAIFGREYNLGYSISDQTTFADVLSAITAKLTTDNKIPSPDKIIKSYITTSGNDIDASLNGTARIFTVLHIYNNGYYEFHIRIKENQHNNTSAELIKNLNNGEYYTSQEKSATFGNRFIDENSEKDKTEISATSAG